jgi:hypothetical protein
MISQDMDGFNESNKFNIDVEFFGVAFVKIPTSLSILQINEIVSATDDSTDSIKNFEIVSKNGVYYIQAEGFIVGKNEWVNEDRTQNMSLKYDELLFS